MESIIEILMVIGLFLARIGLPVLALVGLGAIVERAYRRNRTS